VKGPNFIGLHELFDAIQVRVAGFVDDIAERAVALGGIVDGTTGLGTRSVSGGNNRRARARRCRVRSPGGFRQAGARRHRRGG
jgi:hypothetical protein